MRGGSFNAVDIRHKMRAAMAGFKLPCRPDLICESLQIADARAQNDPASREA
jgi:hypothetical protein